MTICTFDRTNGRSQPQNFCSHAAGVVAARPPVGLTLAMPRKGKRKAGCWDPRLQDHLAAAEKQAWLAIFEAGLTPTDPTDKDACAPTLHLHAHHVCTAHSWKFEGTLRVCKCARPSNLLLKN